MALGIQHTMRMRHIVICSLFGSTTFIKSHKWRYFLKKKIIEHKMCVSNSLQFCLKHLFILRRTEGDMMTSPSCHYVLLMYPSRCKISSTASSSCICVKNDCHRVKTQLQLNKYYYIIIKCVLVFMQSARCSCSI